MEKKNRVTIVYDDGSVEEVEMILAFKFTELEKEYMVYTKEESDDKGNIIIYVGTILKHDTDAIELKGIETEEEWLKIKMVLKNLSKTEEQIEEELQDL